ncbi:MAG: M23 family metallopeptidase [Verrucomicrobia bacterium]|nr:M23 family metallopeptidase [Verrucomicrobiota bacterium]
MTHHCELLVCLSLAFGQVNAAPAPASPASPRPVFSFSPVELADIQYVIPLGNLNPRHGHIFPTDHIYLVYEQPRELPVYAPASGTVLAIRGQSGDDYKLEVRVSDTFSYYLAHLFLEPGIQVGSRIEAGQVVGRTSGRASFDLGCCDATVTLRGFVNPKRYPDSTLHAVSPLKFFAEPLKSSLYAKVEKSARDKDGKIDLDIPGRLVGNWFLEGLPVSDSARGTPSVWEKQLAFVYDVCGTNVLRVSIGGTIAPAGAYRVAGGAPDPATVSMASGKVRYKVVADGSRTGARSEADRHAIVLVQMLAEDRIKVEFFPEDRPDATEFTAAASVYVR